MQRVTRILSLAIPGLTLLAACAARQEVRYGPESALGNGTVRTYLITDESGRAAELGVAISDVAMATVPDLSQNRPMESFITIDLELPEGAPAPYKLVGFFWKPVGHPPVGIYDVPHFEFHFYTIDAATRNAIVPGEGDVPSETGEFVEGRFAERASKAPAPGYLPATYAYTPGSAVPMMGGHWIDRQSHEFHGQLFDRTLVYGTWDGEVIFIQPMITRAFIESKPQGTFEIPLTQKAHAPGWHPSAYTVKYDADAKEYRIGLAGFAEPG